MPQLDVIFIENDNCVECPITFSEDVILKYLGTFAVIKIMIVVIISRLP